MNNELNGALEHLEERHRVDMEAACAEIAAARTEVLSISAERDKLLADLAEPMKWKQERDSLKDDQESLLSMIKDLRGQLDECETERYSLSEKAKKSESLAAEQANEIEKLLKRDKEREIAWSELSAQFSLVSNNLTEKRRELAEKDSLLQKERQNLAEIKQELTRALQTMQTQQLSLQDFESCKLFSKGQSERLELLERDLQQTRIDLASARAGEDAHKHTIARLESLVSEQQAFALDLNSKLIERESEREKLTATTMQLLCVQEELSRLSIEKETAERERDRLKTQVASWEDDRRERSKDHERHLIDKTNELERTRAMLTKVQGDAEGLVSSSFRLFLLFVS